MTADIHQFDYDGLVAEFATRFGKGDHHAGALFKAVYRAGARDPGALPEFRDNPALAQKVRDSFRFDLPDVAGRFEDGDTYKFLLRFRDGLESESVVIPMRQYTSLCVSSQVGCARGCTFCETAQMGLLRNLSAAEIVAQVQVARHVLQERVENVVFMGMGEPLDNLDAVVRAVRILADDRGLAIPARSITISTVGHVDGLRRLATLPGFPRVRLAVSLNAPDDALRSRIMPVNRTWPLAELKEALLAWPLARRDDFLFMEYVVIPGVNDGPEHALATAAYLKGLKACVNLIPYNPRRESPYEAATREGVERFFSTLLDAGQYARIRSTKGRSAMAACGQLGNRELRRSRP